MDAERRSRASVTHGRVQPVCGAQIRVCARSHQSSGVLWLLLSVLSQARARAHYSINDKLGDGGYDALYQWSVDNISDFWGAVWEYVQMQSSAPYTQVVDNPSALPGAKWFEGARLNFAQNLLRFRDDRTALVFRSDCSVSDIKVTYRHAAARVGVVVHAGVSLRSPAMLRLVSSGACTGNSTTEWLFLHGRCARSVCAVAIAWAVCCPTLQRL